MLFKAKLLSLLLPAVTAAAIATAVKSAAATAPEPVRNAVELYVGEKDRLTLKNDPGKVSWSSSDDSVVTVDGEGNVEAAGTGTAVVTVSAAGGSAEIRIFVVEKEYGFDDNIMISVFWPPTKNYINDEQYKYLADAGITWVMGSGDKLGAKDVQLRMLELCYKYGIHMTVGDDRLGINLLSMSDEQIRKAAEEYRNVPGANGYYLLDEPKNPNVFIDAYRTLKSVDPASYMHLNFLPYASYSSLDTYKSQMNDWLKLCARTGYPQDYLMYDLYPFGLEKGSMNRTGFLLNLNAVREVGLANGVRTGTYIQSVTQSVAFRSPTESETRYEINMALAFGVKQLSYFTWFTPYQRSEPFEDGIISWDGVPNPKYEFICRLNEEVKNLGAVLIKCDSLEVYEGRSKYGAMELIPDDFFVKPVGKADITVAYLKNRETGRDYCMVVNNDFSKGAEFTLQFDSAIGSLSYISEKDGTERPEVMGQDNTVTFELGAGAARLFVLPEGYDYSKVHAWKPQKGENYALHAAVSCDTSVGDEGWYMDNLNDGIRFGIGSENGWRTAKGSTGGTVDIDLGRVLEVNRVDIYPAGDSFAYGKNFPRDFTLSFSADGENWYKIAEAKDLEVIGKKVPSLRFTPVNARYLRVSVTAFNGNCAEIGEIEVYYDDGSVPDPERISDQQGDERGLAPIDYKEGGNLAKGRPVTVSSYPHGSDYKGWGWWPDYLVDGTDSKGWTSNVKANSSEDATEYCIIDLQDRFAIDRIEVVPLGCWPRDFTLSVSDDKVNWTEVASETGSKAPENKYIADGIGTTGRYVMLHATKLRGTAADGYMLQIGDIAVYGTPVKDADEAQALMDRYVQAGGSTTSELYKAVGELLADENATQSRLDAALRAMLESVSLEMPGASGAPDEEGEYEFSYDKIPEDIAFATPEPIDDGNGEGDGGKSEKPEKASMLPYIIGGISAVTLATVGVLIAAFSVKKKKKKDRKEEN